MPRIIHVLYFAVAREKAGTSRETLRLEAAAPTVKDLLAEIAFRHPMLSPLLPRLRVAVNQEICGEEAPVPEGAEVALIPPVSGGSGLFQVVDRPLRLAEVVEAVGGEAFGGLVTFTGSVRDQTRGRQVLELEYEAYRPMAERTFREIAEEAGRRWPGARLSILHRVGTLKPGELAVVIAAAAAHRDEAFASCRFAIERLKEQAPIWKKERYLDGEVWVGLGP